jgi:hypothetical protein
MALGIAILSFFGFEFLVALTIQNLETGFLPAIIVAGIVYCLVANQEQKIHRMLDNPAIESYDLPIGQAYAITKRVLKTFHYGKRRWRIEHLEKSTYSLAAVSEWQDYSWKENKILVPDGYLERKVILQIAFRRSYQTRLTELGMRWNVDSPLGRGECNELQSYTTGAIRKALMDAISVHKEFTVAG